MKLKFPLRSDEVMGKIENFRDFHRLELVEITRCGSLSIGTANSAISLPSTYRCPAKSHPTPIFPHCRSMLYVNCEGRAISQGD